MKRSEINAAIRKMETLIDQRKFELPPYCDFTPEEWEKKGCEYNGIRESKLGWDITDYGLGRFDEVGLALITLRNGNQKHEKDTKTYTEKLLMLSEEQMMPMHFHRHKTKDIINRGGGNVLVTVYNSNEDGSVADTEVTVNCDGRETKVPAGTSVCLAPGESITIHPYLYHKLHAKKGQGAVLLGEVSTFNDNDSHFYEMTEHFPAIEEDEKPYRFLSKEYPAAK